MKKQTTNQTTKATFTDLLREYEHSARTQTDEHGAILNSLATAISYAVLKKCISVSQDKTLIQTQRDIAKAQRQQERIKYASENAYQIKFNQEGDAETEIVNADLHKALENLCAQTLGNGLDLVNTAVVAILEETQKAKQRNGLDGAFLEEIYQVRRLKRKVWIRTEDSAKGWETVDTTAIQEVYKAVRRYIANNNAVKVAQNGYSYLEQTATDTETDTDTIIYRRFGKYADIGGEVKDINGKVTAYTTDEQTATDIDILIEKLNLTDREMKILQLRLSGYGYKAIATYMGISVDNAKRCAHRLQEKALKCGLTPIK